MLFPSRHRTCISVLIRKRFHTVFALGWIETTYHFKFKDTSMVYCISIIQILIIIWVRYILRSSKSKPQRFEHPCFACFREGRSTSFAILFFNLVILISFSHFPFPGCNMPSLPTYDVFISQLFQYGRACSSNDS